MSDYESWLVKKEEKAEQKNAVFWLIFCIIIIGIAVGIILTGMGNDGAKGLLEMRRAGAKTIGQNEASCIVYGMPKAAYDIGAVQQQAELTQIAQKTYDCLETVR